MPYTTPIAKIHFWGDFDEILSIEDYHPELRNPSQLEKGAEVNSFEETFNSGEYYLNKLLLDDIVYSS